MFKILFFLLLSFLRSDVLSWEEVEKQEGYFGKIIDNNFVIVMFFDSSICPSCINQALTALKPLEKNE